MFLWKKFIFINFFFLLSVNVILPVNYIIVISDKHNPAVYYVNINFYQVTNWHNEEKWNIASFQFLLSVLDGFQIKLSFC